jgi:hypothetical protein
MKDIKPKVVTLPVVNRVKFYREHLERSANSIREMMMDLCQVQDRLYAEIIEMENSLLELQEEIERVQRLTSNKDTKENDNADKI